MTSQRLRLLIVEDTPADAEIEAGELRRAGLDFELRVVETADEYRGALESFRPDLVLSDYSLPAFDGIEAVALAGELAPGTPVVIVTGPVNEETAVACMRAGAADYVLKDRLGQLAPAVRRALDEAKVRREKAAVEGAAPLDATDRRRSEARLRQLSQAVEQSPAVVMITDERGRIEYANPRFTEVTGYTLEETIGQNPRLLKSGETSAEEYRVLWDTIANGGIWRGEFRNRRKDGSLFWEDASISGIRSAAGRITHYVAVKEDITERKRSQQSLEEAQAQLARAQKMDAVGRLAGGVAHDFNNLLGVIRGHADLLALELPDGHPGRTRLDQIQKSTDRAAGLARQLLAFGRKQTLRLALLRLEAVVVEAEKMLRRVIGEDVELGVDLEPGLPPVLADSLQIEQVLLNLAVNARDAMPGGGRLSFKVASEITQGARRRVVLSVADTGCGMDEETLGHIFEPFFTTKEVGKGMGLGLASVYGIVSQLGGEIQVSSTPGEGTTFRIFLPAVEGVSDVAPAPPKSRAGKGGGEVVLVVEDEDGLRGLIVELLESLGYRVLQAARGAEALEIARRHPGRIDLLLTDVVMPGQNGRELARQLRGLRPEIRVVMMSGYATDALAGENGMPAATRLLNKPFSQEDLASTLREALLADE
jgi:two-component system cell cycle sensor histidine kinase/response regulator CckA